MILTINCFIKITVLNDHCKNKLHLSKYIVKNKIMVFELILNCDLHTKRVLHVFTRKIIIVKLNDSIR